MHSVLVSRNRDPETLYDHDTYGSVRFSAKTVQNAGASVIASPQQLDIEQDADRAAAHADVMAPIEGDSRQAKDAWMKVVEAIQANFDWIQPYDS